MARTVQGSENTELNVLPVAQRDELYNMGIIFQ